MSGGGAPSARLRTLAGQSAIYGIGPVVARFAGLLLLPIYTRHLGEDEVANVGQVVALVAVGATIAQLGLVNALFRFAAERQGDARFAVARTAIALCCAAGLVVAAVAVLATPLAAPLFLLGDGHEDLWLVACGGLLVSLLYEPCAGLYRVEQRPGRFLAVTLVNVAVTVVISVIWIVRFDGGALAMVAGSFTGTLVALAVVLWDRRTALFGPIDRELIGPLLRFGLPFMPSRVALWGLNLSNRLLVGWLATASLAGVFVVGANLAQAVALLVTAFQLAWPPFAYGIEDDDEARTVYRSVLTLWLLVALAVVLPLALAREWVVATLAGEKWLGGADAMALIALGLAFYGAYYVVGVAVGRAKRTQLNWVVTGIAALTNVALCIVLIPDHGATGAGIAMAAAYLLMAVLMVVRGNRVFPVGYDWARLAGICVLAAGIFALGEAFFAARGTEGSPSGSSWPPSSRRSRSPQIGQCVAQRLGRDGRLLAGRAGGGGQLLCRREHAQPRAGERLRGRDHRARPHEHEPRPERLDLVVGRESCAEALVARVARPAQRDVPAVRDGAVEALERAHDQGRLGARRPAGRGQGAVTAGREHAGGERLVVAEEEIVAGEPPAEVAGGRPEVVLPLRP